MESPETRDSSGPAFHQAGAATSTTLTHGKVEQFDDVLKYLSLCRGVQGALVVTQDGLVVSSTLPQGMEPETWAPMVTIVQESSQKCMARIKQEDVTQMVLRTASSLIVAVRVGALSLVVVAEEHTPIEFLQIRLARAVQMLANLMRVRYGEWMTVPEVDIPAPKAPL